MRTSDVVFFLTGAAALVYETVWARSLARLCGSDSVGLGLVLAVFMGGMALGAALGGGLARRTSNPRALFAGLELGLGAWAAATPLWIGWIDAVGPFPARAGLAVLALLPPTAAMGATFPLMGRLTIADDRDTRTGTSSFYGANTLGAASGALLGPFVLMPLVGLGAALVCAALIDALAAGLALGWLRDARADPVAPPAATHQAGHTSGTAGGTDEPAARGGRSVLAVTCLLGFASLGLELLLTRLLVGVTGASVYALSIVLAVFLGGLGLGARQAARPAALSGRLAPERTLFACALAAPLLALLGLLALRWQLQEPDLFASLANRMPTGAGLVRLWASHALFAGLAVLPPAFAFGMALPSAVAEYVARRPGPREVRLARVYLANTLGALAGSLATAFLLLPHLGPRTGVALLLGVCLLAALLAPGRHGGALAGGVLATIALGAWVLAPSRTTEADGGRAVLMHGFDAHATVSVEEDGAGLRTLRVNGKPVASTAPVDLRLQRLLGHIPGLLHGRVEDALVIGLGTGMTAGSLLDLPTVGSVRVLELSPAVVDAARSFADWNGALLDDPRVEVIVADGRHALAHDPARYDLVTSDPIHPWTRGSSDLYSLEHFRAMSAHLAPGGIASQWLPLYQLSTEDVRTIVATWCAAFQGVQAWLSAYDLVLIGTNGGTNGGGAKGEAGRPAALESLLERPLASPVARALAAAGIHSGAELCALLVADDDALRAYAAGAVPMRDDRPVLEFRAPLSYLAGYAVEPLRWAARESFVERLPERSRERAREVRGLVLRFLERLPQGTTRAAELYGEELLALPPLD